MTEESTDDGNITMGVSPGSSKARNDFATQPSLIVNALRDSKSNKDLKLFKVSIFHKWYSHYLLGKFRSTDRGFDYVKLLPRISIMKFTEMYSVKLLFQKLINMKFPSGDRFNSERMNKWKHVIIELLRILTNSENIGDKQILLGSIALITVLFNNCNLEEFTTHLKTYWTLEKPILSAFGEDIQIRDLELFKLVIAHGYTAGNIKEIYVREILSLPFAVLRKNCLRYAKYSYFAYKVLQSWLDKTVKYEFWRVNDTSCIETDIASIISSNWNSAIHEIARRNATQIFPTYLIIMNDKDPRFLNTLFESCVQNLPWQNVTKYTMLTEICKISKDLSAIINMDLAACIFTSLTKNDLKHAGTKLYLTIIHILKKNDWERLFLENLFRISKMWENE